MNLRLRLKGSVGAMVFSGLTLITFGGIAMQMGFSNYKIRAEKQLHILNSIRFSTIIQIGLEEGWLTKPINGQSETFDLITVDASYPLSTTLRNPSLKTQKYSTNSNILVSNTNGKYTFYAQMIEDQSTHIYISSSKEIYNLDINDVSLNN